MSISQSKTGHNGRRWTGEQLQEAVKAQHSWRGVARALGLSPTSTLAIRRYAAELKLDTSHFTGQRPWSDLQLRKAVANGSTWAEVLRILKVDNNGESLVRVKGHAARLGLDSSHLAPPTRPTVPTEVTALSSQREHVRTAATAIAMSWFLLRGLASAVPAEPQEYDLLVAFPDGIKRVQVKSSTHRTSSGRWSVNVGQRPYSLDKSANRAPYDPGALDYCFVVTGDGGLYLVPGRALAGRTGIYIDYYPEYRVGDASSLLNWGTGESAP